MKLEFRNSSNSGRSVRWGWASAVALIVLAALRLGAAEIRLKEGKTIQGKIERETPDEVMIKTGPLMFLRIDRDKISEIVRDPKKPAGRLVVSVHRSTGTATAAPEIRRCPGGVVDRTHKTETVTLTESVMTELIPIQGSTPGELEQALKSRRPVNLVTTGDGVPASEGNVHRWKSFQLKSRVTLGAPDWQTPQKPLPATILWWNSALAKVQTENEGRLQIVNAVLDASVQALSALFADSEEKLRSESEKILALEKDRALHRIEGYDRHRGATPIVKKTPSKAKP